MSIYSNEQTKLALCGVTLPTGVSKPPCWSLVYRRTGRTVTYTLIYSFIVTTKEDLQNALEIVDAVYNALLSRMDISDLATSGPEQTVADFCTLEITYTGGCTCSGET